MRTIKVFIGEDGYTQNGFRFAELLVLGEREGALVCRPENNSYGWKITQRDIDTYNINPRHLGTPGWYVDASQEIRD